MVHFIRNAENRTIIECEVTSKDLSASVDILYYTEHYRSLYEKDISSAVLFMDKMCDISNIRSWWWILSNSGSSPLLQYASKQSCWHIATYYLDQ